MYGVEEQALTQFTNFCEKGSQKFRDFQEKPNVRRPASALRSVFPQPRRNKVIYARGFSPLALITTRDHRVCYCSEQDDEWICESCYKDFKELFGRKLEED